ncbi:MAG: methylmalonyl-CoA epimerase [Planctomycetota bacterium]|nr:methylmalonyl-CoA epimerase [Planctomycetota bacterium]MEE2712372.1 methylmalonyl-CoA epimerase [Planctomycetota bacterium]
MLKGIDHVAIAVPSVDEALPLWRDRFGFDLEDIEVVQSQQVRVAILTKGPHRIELMEPTEDDSPVGRFLARRGPGIHHLCLGVDGIEVMLDDLGAAGVRLVDEEPKPGAHDKRVAFVHPKGTGGVLVELSE